MRLPIEARDGIARVWLSLLAEKQPAVTWVLVDPPGKAEDEPCHDSSLPVLDLAAVV